MANAPPPSSSPRPRRPRRPRFDNANFGSLTPWDNPAAVYSYGVAWAGLVPVLGLPLGLAAVVFGIVGLMRQRRRPEIMGRNFAIAGMTIGLCDALFNAAGIWCVGRGWNWW